MTRIDSSESDHPLRTYRIRTALFLAGVVAALAVLGAVYRGINTINRLEVVEFERDSWQRPAEVLQALNLRDGGVVVDLGCGAGYFALKLSQAVGGRGRVLAVDIRKLPLLFLRIRALLRKQHNITVVQGRQEGPDLPGVDVDAVLIANTYHELSNPKAILNHVFRSMVPGGRLVVIDRGPTSMNVPHRERDDHYHQLPAATVERELLQSGFEVIRRQDHFIERPVEESWWLIVARKP